MISSLDYETQRLQNIRKNNAILASLGINENQKRSIITINTKKGRSTVKLPRKRVLPDLPRRRSKRVQGIKADPLFLPNDFREPSKDRYSMVIEEKPSIQGNVEVEEDGKIFFESLKQAHSQQDIKHENTSKSLDLLNYAEKLSKLDVSENRVLKVTPGRSYSLDVSPDSHNIIAVSGDKEGMIGLWQYRENDENAKLFNQRIHSDSISSLYFDRQDSSKLYTTSYDGRVSLFDAEKMAFEELYSTDTLLFDLTLTAQKSIFVAKRDGCLTQLDMRTNKVLNSFKLHENKINSVEQNPVDANYVVTASLDRSVGVWDLRQLKKEISLIGHPLAISHSAYSTDGNSIVSLCNDDLIHCFGFSTRTIDEKTAEFATFRHNNRTGRWLTRFKLNFNKRMKASFVVGCMDQPRCVEVFNLVGKKCKRVMRLRSEYIKSVQSLNVFHDSLDVIASVNASGRVHVWK